MLLLARRCSVGALLAGQARRRAMSTLGTLYTAPGTPSPDTVHMYLHEAGATELVNIEKVNINKAANREDTYTKINPMGEVPALVLADGSAIAESLVICRYIDSMRTDGAGSTLTGTSPAEAAETDQWCARAETKYLTPLFWAVRCGPLAKFFANRTPGYIHPEVAEPMGVAAKAGQAWLDAQLATRPYLCGERFTIADIRLYVNYKFLTSVAKKLAATEDEAPAFTAYIARIAERESAKAILPPPRKK